MVENKVKARLSDVAKKAETSESTASLVLNGRGEHMRIPKGTRDAVLSAAKELGYITPSKRKNKKRHCVALALLSSSGHSEHEYFHEYFLHLSAELTRSNLFQLTNTGVAFNDLPSALTQGPLANADAFILPTLEPISEGRIKALDSIKKPYIILNRRSHPTRHCVVNDNYDRGYKLANKMYNAGHTWIAYITPVPSNSQAFGERLAGISKAATERGLLDRLISIEKDNSQDPDSYLEKIFNDHKDISALIAHSQAFTWLAIEVYARINPGKILSAASLDHHGAIATPADKRVVTGYKTSVESLCKEAVRFANNILRKKTVAKNTIIEVAGEFIKGETIHKADT